MKLANLLENRAELLHLQQKLIDDLPDEFDVTLGNYPLLGDCVRTALGHPGGAKIRYMKTASAQGKVSVATHDNTHWREYNYDSVIGLMKQTHGLRPPHL